MAFPNDPLDVGIEFHISGAWVDSTSYVLSPRDSVTTFRGRPNEGTQESDPSRMSFTLDNRTLIFSPRNPEGALYGEIGRNTPVRHWIKTGTPRLRLDGGEQFYTADSAAISITGDIDLRADVYLPTWRPSVISYIGGPIKGDSYGFYLNTSGHIVLAWYSGAVLKNLTSSEPIPGPTTGRKAVRVTFDVNNGAGGHTARFYYSDDNTMDGTWVEFGDAQIGSGTTSIDNTTDTLGCYLSAGLEPADVFEARVYSGIAGTKVASPKFTTQTNGATSFADAEGNTWQTDGFASLDNLHYRFTGDVPAWPPSRDRSGNDKTISIEAAGVLRRLGQGNQPLQSALRRGIPKIGAALVGYWPCEDGASAASLEAGTADTLVGRVIGPVELATYTGFVASEQTPQLGTGRLYFRVPYYVSTDEFQIRFIMHVPPSTIPNGTVLLRIKTNSSLGWIDWIYNTGDVMVIKTYTNLGVLSHTTSGFDITSQVTDQDTRISLEFAKNGSGVDLKQVVLPIGESLGAQYTETNSGITLGSASSIYFNPDGVDLGDFSVGHVTVENDITSVFDSAHALERAYQGERANDRIERLGTEAGLDVYLRGWENESEYLGYQGQLTLVRLLQEAASVDSGILTEARFWYDTIEYRSYDSIINQTPKVSLDFGANSIQRFASTDDDLYTRNLVTVARADGARATVEDTDSGLSTSAPPDGVGTYDDYVQLSLYGDGQPQHQASWRVRLGTVDEARVPQIEINLAHPDFVADPDLVYSIMKLECGDMIEIANPPDDLPPDAVRQIILGMYEITSQFEHTLIFNCAPASPYRTAVLDAHPDTPSVISNENTTTNEALDTTETGVDVAYSYGPDWSHADGDYDIMIGGERMTVTAVTGSGGSQTLTVTRSVNGVVKSHATGRPVRLAEPVFYGLGASGGAGLNTDIAEGKVLRAMDVALPDVVTEYGNGTNTITSTSFAELPSFPCHAYFTNPHPTSNILVEVGFGAWGSSSTGDVRCSVRIERSEQTTIAAGVAVGGSAGYGEIPATAITTTTAMFATFTCELPPSPKPYVLKFHAMRSTASGTQDVRYATIRVIPLRYVEV